MSRKSASFISHRIRGWGGRAFNHKIAHFIVGKFCGEPHCGCPLYNSQRENPMRASADHILTSHVGSLPRPDALIAANNSGDRGAIETTLTAAVREIVRQQHEIGIDVPGDG